MPPTDRLDFVLHDFTRLSWVSDAARDLWGPRLHRVTEAWFEIEWRAVLAGLRRCGVTVTTPEGLIERAAKWVGHGLNALPVELHGARDSYASTGEKARLGEPFVFRIAVGIPEDVAEFKQVWDAADNRGIGGFLGYPECCLDFFEEHWVDGQMIDTTWPMAVASSTSPNGTRDLEITGPPEANILWRWMGARAVPHLPCRSDCEATVEFGRALIDVGRGAGFDEEMDWLLEILSWPVEWSALHGIAEIKTPILKVVSRADATRSKYTVRRPGTAYPEAGAQGLKFPYQMPRKTITESRGYKRGLDNPIEAARARPGWYASDNGFASIAAMDQAHTPIIGVADATLDGEAASVLDLGCGNGALLEGLRDANPKVVPYGVEIDAERLEHARTLFPDHVENFTVGDMFSEEIWQAGRRYALVLLMPGRLLEAGPERAAWLREQIKAHCDHVLVYAYGDWLTKYRDLQGLARRAGLSLLSSGSGATVSLAKYRKAGEQLSEAVTS